MPNNEQSDALIVGGGFYGCALALCLAAQGKRVALLEKEARILRGASYANQARVHQGYHYPRAILTAQRSHAHYARFLKEYADCIDDTFDAYYAVARVGSKVTAAQFQTFCQRIDAPLKPAPFPIKKLFDAHWIEDVWSVSEAVFNADRLAERFSQMLAAAGVSLHCETEARRIEMKEGQLCVQTHEREFFAKQVYLCAYSRTNELLGRSNVMPLALKQEIAEMALVELPEALRHVGVTVMCGPYFSCLPFPARPGLHTLSHVRYTPHASWIEGSASSPAPFTGAWPATHFPQMVRDAARYMPLLSQARYQESLWAIKTVLPVSETDDSRPILYLRDHGFPGLTCILGGKIDNVYDMFREVELG